MIKTAIVILNWNGRHFLEQFLGGVVESASKVEGTEVIVADNASSDDSVDWLMFNFPQVELILFDQNNGFTGGYNRALSQLEANYFLLLNSDIEVTPGWLDPLVTYMDKHADTAACAPKLLAYDNRTMFEHAGAAGGFIDRYGYPFCRGRILEFREHDHGQYDAPMNIFWATGAALMIRATLYHKAGGLNEHFFAHMEEIDLCWRLHRMGYKVASIPQSVVYHVGGGALPYSSPRKLYLNFRNNLFMLANNLPGRKLVTTLFARLLLDGLSGLVYLSKGQFSNFTAVIKAHGGFYYGLPACYRNRKKFRTLNRQEACEGIYNGSIVYRYFKAKKQLKFSDLQIDGNK